MRPTVKAVRLTFDGLASTRLLSGPHNLPQVNGPDTSLQIRGLTLKRATCRQRVFDSLIIQIIAASLQASAFGRTLCQVS